MKKALSMILVLTMVLALALPAMAVDDITTTGDTSKSVTATYKGPSSVIAGKVYSVTIAWEDVNKGGLTFTDKKTAYVWHPELMQYVAEQVDGKTEAAKWNGNTGVKVTVTNKSNDAISFTAEASKNYEDLVVACPADSVKVESAVKGITDANVAEKVANWTDVQPLSGTLEATYTAPVTTTTKSVTLNEAKQLVVGTITVTITHDITHE